MKVIVDPQELYQVLQAVKKCVPNKATLPALRHVQMVAGLGRLQLAGTDLSSAVVAPVPAEVQEEGEVLVPAKELDQRLAQLRKRAEVITLESPPESWDLTITTETATIPIKGMDPNEYVAINAVTAEELDAAVGEDQPPVGRLAAFEATDLATAIRQVAPAALSGKSASRKSRELWSLTYVWLTGETSAGVVRLMATDTTHLHYVEIPAVVFQNFAVGIHNTTAISLLQGEVTLAGRAKADDDEPGWSLLTLLDDHGLSIVLNPAREQRPRGEQKMAQIWIEQPPETAFSCPVRTLKQALAALGRSKDEDLVTIEVAADQVRLIGQGDVFVGQVAVDEALAEMAGPGFSLYAKQVRAALAMGPHRGTAHVAYWPPESGEATFAKFSFEGAAYALLAPQSPPEDMPPQPSLEASGPRAVVDVGPFLEALKVVRAIIPSRASRWRSVLLEAAVEGLRLTTACPAEDQSDQRQGQTETVISLTVPAQIQGFTATLVPAKKLAELVSRAKSCQLDQVTLCAQEEPSGVVVVLGEAKAFLAGFSPDRFPKVALLTPEAIWPKDEPDLLPPVECAVCGETVPPDEHWHGCVICGAPICSLCATSGARCRECEHKDITLAERVAEFNAEAFAAVVDWVALAVGEDDENRPVMTGVWLESSARTSGDLWIVAADGYRLHIYPLPLTRRKEFMVGLRHLDEVAPAFQGRITMYFRGDEEVILTDGRTTVIGTRIDGRYPDYTAVIPNPDPTTEIKAGPEEVLAAAQLVQRGVALHFRADPEQGLTVVGKDAESGEIPELVPAQVRGPANAVALNPRYAMEALAHQDGQVTLAIWSPERPALFTYTSGARALVMPMQF